MRKPMKISRRISLYLVRRYWELKFLFRVIGIRIKLRKEAQRSKFTTSGYYYEPMLKIVLGPNFWFKWR